MNLTMVGTGYVGLVTGACFADMGNKVVCLDVDQRKIDMLRKGESPIYEPGLSEMLKRNIEEKRISFSLEKLESYRHAEAIFICVGTPSDKDGSADLQYVLRVAGDIADALNTIGATPKPKVVIVKSTVPVGTTHKVRDLIASKTKVPFVVADNPEFLKEGNAIEDFMRPDRVVCGVETKEAEALLHELYEPFTRQGNPIYMMDVRSSEMVKYASNAMLACKISFINEIANLCEFYGANVNKVREGMCADKRIGNQFFYPGLGYGGSCFPKDTLAVVGMGKAVGFDCELNASVHRVNQAQRPHFWKKVLSVVPEMKGKILAFWGVTFKPRTDDIREAPAIALMERAQAAGASIRVYDPEGLENLTREHPEITATHFHDMYDALDGADALIICTEWTQFRLPDFADIKRRLKAPIICDGRNLYRLSQMRELGFTYASIGRETVKA